MKCIMDTLFMGADQRGAEMFVPFLDEGGTVAAVEGGAAVGHGLTANIVEHTGAPLPGMLDWLP